MSSLETSVTLEDVFTVVEAKRVPLAPELAGYLSLEIADGTDAGSGDVDPKTVFISEEGTVALVRPKRDSIHGDAEASVRSLLTKLLDASGSGTPALSTAARRKPGNGLPALVEELEAALIPVNRAAGRRALARLAREVKRVLLGVGRNASVPPVVKEAAPKAMPHARPVLRKKATPQVGAHSSGQTQPAAPSAQDDAAARSGEAPKPPEAAKPVLEAAPPEAAPEKDREKRPAVLRRSANSFEPEPATAKRANELTELASSMNAVDNSVLGARTESREGSTETPEPEPAAPRAPPLPPAAVAQKPPPVPPPPAKTSGSSPAPALLKSPPAPPVGAKLPDPQPEPTPGPPALPDTRLRAVVVADPPQAGRETPRVPSADPVFFGRDDVDSLLDSFGVSNQHGDKQMARELKAIAGLSPTPPPPDAKTLAELTKDIGKDLPKRLEPKRDGGDSIEALLALADASGPMPAITIKGAPGSAPQLPEAPPIAPANLPPSPIFGPTASTAAAGSVPGAPAALRQSAVDASASQTPRAADSSRNVAKLDAPPLDRPKARLADKEKPKAELQQPPTTKRHRPTDKRPRAPRTGMAMLVFALLVLAGGTVAIWKFAPHVFTGKKKPPATASTPSPIVAPPPCKVALVLTEVPANAEILLRMGQAPADVERMPVGTRLELVATAEGYSPRRAVLKADDVWNKGPDGKPRIEVPIQLDPSKAKPGAVDPWPAAEPGSQVGGSGAPGTVHVVSNVRGAEVWLLAGLGPEARIDQLRCDADIDVLLAGPPNLRKRLHVGEKEIAAATANAQGNKVLNVSAK
jgi:hypothetical protein